MSKAACPPASDPGIAEPEWLPAGQNLRDVALQLRLLLHRGFSLAIATVVGARGTLLRQPGTVLVINESGQTIGFNPAGPLDGALRGLAAKALATGQDRLQRLRIEADAAAYIGPVRRRQPGRPDAPGGPAYPGIADVSHATAAAGGFFRSYFTAKTSKDIEASNAHFHPGKTVYFDATLGMGLEHQRRPEDGVGAVHARLDGRGEVLPDPDSRRHDQRGHLHDRHARAVRRGDPRHRRRRHGRRQDQVIRSPRRRPLAAGHLVPPRHRADARRCRRGGADVRRGERPGIDGPALTGAREVLSGARQRGTGTPGAPALTTAELRLLPMLAIHLSFREIAGELFLSRHTIKSPPCRCTVSWGRFPQPGGLPGPGGRAGGGDAGPLPACGPEVLKMDEPHRTQRDAALAAAGIIRSPRYQQDLHRSVGILGNIFITLSGVTPASSVFIIAPVALVAAGSGSFLAFAFAAIVGVFMALCWAELSAAYPIAAGDYALVWHSFKGRASWLARPVSFATFALVVDFIAFIPAVIALGTGTYLSVIWTVSSKVIGAMVVLCAAAVAILNIRLNAMITGIFLAIELAALTVVTVLGFTHAKNWNSLIHPVVGNSHGGLTLVPFTAVLAVVAVAVFSYNGYNSSVNFAEETTGSSSRIARAILLALVITVAAELIPVTATIVGSPSLVKLSISAVPMQYFIEATSNKTIYTIVSLGVVIAILNACIAIVLVLGRILFSSGRDRAWPGLVNGWMTLRSSRFRSPWFATAVIGILGAIMCLTVPLTTLVNLTGASLVADYALIAIAALFARPTGAIAHSPYKMPLWPLPPILALISLGYIFTKQPSLLLWVTLITIGIGLAYWLVVIFPQRGRAWTLRHAVLDETAAGQDG